MSLFPYHRVLQYLFYLIISIQLCCAVPNGLSYTFFEWLTYLCCHDRMLICRAASKRGCVVVRDVNDSPSKWVPLCAGVKLRGNAGAGAFVVQTPTQQSSVQVLSCFPVPESSTGKQFKSVAGCSATVSWVNEEH